MVDVCADQLRSWWCITGPKGKSGGPRYPEIQGGVYIPLSLPYADVALGRVKINDKLAKLYEICEKHHIVSFHFIYDE